MSADIGFDMTRYIRTSITEVVETILIAFVLVLLVIFAFLRNWRATLIPVLALPISLVGSFFVMYLSGFSVNILTLLGVVLATGLVVDDAIVVMENIYQKIEQGQAPRAAGHLGAAEVFFAVVATTLALIAVVLPIMFMPGLVGRLFREFGAVVAGAVILSTFVSLTLTPMLCTRILRRHDAHEHSLYGRTEPYFAAAIEWYRGALRRWLARPAIALGIVVASAAAIVLFYAVLPRELAPQEDRSRFSVNVTGAEGVSHEFTREAMERVTAIIEESVPERSGLLTMTGMGASNSAFARVFLAPPAHRTRAQNRIAQDLSTRLRGVTDVRAIVTQEQTVGDRRGSLPVQVVVMAPSLEALRAVIPGIVSEMSSDPMFQVADVNMKFSKPQLQLRVDRLRAQDLGVSTADIAQSLQLAYSGSRYGYFVHGGKQYPIIGQFYRADRDLPLDLASFGVRNRDGEFVTLESMVSWREQGSPPQLFRYNRMVSATVSAGLAPGRTIAEGIDRARAIVRSHLNEGFGVALSGPSRDFAESSSNLLMTFFGALVLVYLVLAAQFESWRHPFTVMLTVPLALAGALFSLWYLGQSLNVFSQIGIIMLVGLVAKNGILIVEFANQRRIAGLDTIEAVVGASVTRFRPIVMTSLTVVLGALPIALALGASARSRMSMGTVVIGGLLFSLVLSLFVVPVMYTMLAGRADARVSTKEHV